MDQPTTEFWRLPGARRVLESWINDVRNRRSVLLLLPDWLDAVGFQQLLLEGLSGAHFYAESLDLSEADDSTSARTVLAAWLGGAGGDAQSAANVASLMHDDLPDAIIVRGMDGCSEEARVDWLRTLASWAAASKEAADAERRPCSMILILPTRLATSPLPRGETHLAIRSLWGLLNALDVQVLCRGDETRTGSPATTWRERVLPALVGDDMGLLERLWEVVLGEIDDIVTELRAYARERAWSLDTLAGLSSAQLHVGYSLNQTYAMHLPPARLVPFWLDGLVSSSIEYGVEVHPAALLVQGHTDRVRHRLWRGQVTLMLPLLDSIRLNMCQELTRRFGQGWPLRLTPPRTEEEVTALKVSALACEYGRLEFLLRQDGRLVDYRTSWQPLAARAKAVRNTLAHYQPVTFGDFEWLESEARKAGVAVSP